MATYLAVSTVFLAEDFSCGHMGLEGFFLCRCFFLFGWGGGRLNRENHAWLFIDFCSIDVYCIDYRWSLTPSGRNEFMV